MAVSQLICMWSLHESYHTTLDLYKPKLQECHVCRSATMHLKIRFESYPLCGDIQHKDCLLAALHEVSCICPFLRFVRRQHLSSTCQSSRCLSLKTTNWMQIKQVKSHQIFRKFVWKAVPPPPKVRTAPYEYSLPQRSRAHIHTHRHIHLDTYTHSHMYTKIEKHIHTCIHPHMLIFHTRT